MKFTKIATALALTVAAAATAPAMASQDVSDPMSFKYTKDVICSLEVLTKKEGNLLLGTQPFDNDGAHRFIINNNTPIADLNQAQVSYKLEKVEMPNGVSNQRYDLRINPKVSGGVEDAQPHINLLDIPETNSFTYLGKQLSWNHEYQLQPRLRSSESKIKGGETVRVKITLSVNCP